MFADGLVQRVDAAPLGADRLDEICDRFGLLPPWQQHRDTVAPISAKRGSIDPLTGAVREHLHEAGRDDLFTFF